MTIYLASNNAHKKKEMAEIFSPYQIKIPADDKIIFDPEETGTTFVENSLIKAKALWDIVHQPVLADDSGICVDALADEHGSVPGIYSARYEGITFPRGKPAEHGNAKLTSTEQNERLIQHLNTVTGCQNRNRSCHYVCSMVLYLAPDKFYCIQETLEGEIVSDMAHSCGTGGFGYDPIVFLPSFGKTVAELTATEKNAVSHRGKAGRIIKAIIDSNLS